MSVLSRPPVARSVARLLQLGVRAGARRMSASAHARLPEHPRRTEEVTVPTAVGSARVTVYRPRPSDRVPAVHVNLHGGGFVLPVVETDDPLCRALADQADVVVLNVDYVVAPQHPFPAAVHQVYEVLRWVTRNGAEHGWDGARLTVGGQSAGGGLTAAAARLARDAGDPEIALQVLHYPPLDLSVPGASKRSVIAKPMLRPWMATVFDTAYAPDPSTRGDRLMSPAGDADTGDITGIAPAVVIAAEHDLLRDEVRRYADRLDRAGALVEYREVAGVDHGYDLEDEARARETYAFVADHVRRATAR